MARAEVTIYCSNKEGLHRDNSCVFNMRVSFIHGDSSNKSELSP